MIKVLLLDSNIVMRRILKSIIQKFKFEVEIVEVDNEKALNSEIVKDVSLLITNIDISRIEILRNQNFYIILDDVKIRNPKLKVVSIITRPFKKNFLTQTLDCVFDLIENQHNIERIHLEDKTLIVDDKVEFRLLLKEQLKAIGINDILEAENGRQAIELIAENSDIKILFIDLNMPVMNGKDLLLQLEKTRSIENIRTILLSSSDFCLNMVENNYKKFLKPFKLFDLAKIIEDLDDSALIDLDSGSDVENDGVDVALSTAKELEIEMPPLNSANEIQATYTVEEAIDIYLQKYKNSLQDGKKTISIKKKFEYSKIKRFIFTAYHHLMDIDVSIKGDKDLAENAKTLVDMEKSFSNLTKHKKFPLEMAYEKMFLNQQNNYVYFDKQFHNIDIEIENTNNRIKMLYEKLEEIKELIGLQENSHRVDELTKIFKVINKNYVDMIHNLSILKTNSENLDKLLQAFREKYISTFRESYMEKLKSVESELYEVLNICSYNFDYKLWERARKSLPIKNFFIKSEIIGNFSTLTFLEYYLKTIDSSKTDDKNIALIELVNYLREVDCKNITVVAKTMQEASHMKDLISSIDKKYRVTALVSVIKLLDLTMPIQDLIIMDTESTNFDLKLFFKEYKRAYKMDSLDDVSFILIFDKYDKDVIFNYMERGFIESNKNFLIRPKHLMEAPLKEKILALV